MLSTPNWFDGFARSPDESEAPEQWKGLVANYATFLGVQGGTLYDLSGYQNHGAFTNMDLSSSWRMSDRGVTLELLSSVNGFVALGNGVSLQLTTGTVSAWIKTLNAGSSFRGIVVKNTAYGLFLIDNVLAVYDWGAGVERSTGVSVADNTWHCVAFSFDSGVSNGTIIYIDGVARLSTIITVSSPSASAMVLGAGTAGGGQNFVGFLDDVRIYDRVLSAAEVCAAYADPLAMYRLRPLIFTTAGTQYSRPSSDVSTGNWTTATLATKIDEVDPDDGDFISSGINPNNDTCVMGMTALGDSLASTGHRMSVRARKDSASGQRIDLVAEWRESTTVRATLTMNDLLSSFTTYTYDLSGAEADSLASYGAPRLALIANGTTIVSPAIGDTATTDGSTATTNCVVNLPQNIIAGNLILVLFRGAAGGAVGWPDAGWNEMFEDTSDATDDVTAMAWRKATGAEGATITVTTGTSGKFGALAWRITGAEDPTIQAPEFATLAVGTTANPDPGTVTPTGGSKPYLFLAVMASDGEATSPPGTFPTNYSLNQIAAQSGTAGVTTTNVRLAGAGRQLTAASDNPGTYTVSVAPAGWTATTVAIHPIAARQAQVSWAQFQVPQPPAGVPGVPPAGSLSLLGIGL